MFGGGEPEGPNGIMAELMKMNSGGMAAIHNPELDYKQIEASLQTMALKYSSFVFHDITIAVQVVDSVDYFIFSHSTGNTINKR